MTKRMVSRRRFITGAAAVGSGGTLLSAQAREMNAEEKWEPGTASPPENRPIGPLRFFNADERTFVEAAIDRLIPPDDWPGAKELGVANFLDDQLSGSFGRAEVWYMQGPWPKGEETQGYQSRLTPAKLYRAAIAGIEDHCRKNFDGKSFADLAPDEQDKLLKRMEDGKVAIDGADAKTFFTMLLQNTTEGYFGDPVHGGNRDMMAWKMIGFPGARYDYRPYVKKHNQKLDIEPVSVGGVGSFGRRKPDEEGKS